MDVSLQVAHQKYPSWNDLWSLIFWSFKIHVLAKRIHLWTEEAQKICLCIRTSEIETSTSESEFQKQNLKKLQNLKCYILFKLITEFTNVQILCNIRISFYFARITDISGNRCWIPLKIKQIFFCNLLLIFGKN